MRNVARPRRNLVRNSSLVRIESLNACQNRVTQRIAAAAAAKATAAAEATFEKNERVMYTNSDGVTVRATVIMRHSDGRGEPYYTILVDGGEREPYEKQTTGNRLTNSTWY